MCGAPVKSVLYSPEHTRGAPLTRKPGNSLAHRVDGNIMMDTGGRQRKLGFHTTLLMAVTGTAANHLEGCISRLWLHLFAKIIFAWVKSRNKMSSRTCPQHLCLKIKKPTFAKSSVNDSNLIGNLYHLYQSFYCRRRHLYFSRHCIVLNRNKIIQLPK